MLHSRLVLVVVVLVDSHRGYLSALVSPEQGAVVSAVVNAINSQGSGQGSKGISMAGYFLDAAFVLQLTYQPPSPPPPFASPLHLSN